MISSSYWWCLVWKRAGWRDVSLPAHLQWHPPLARQRWGGPHAHQLPRLAQQPSGLRERGQPACLPAHSGYAGPGRWAGSPGASLRRRGEALCKPARHQQCWQTKVAGAAMPSAGGRATCPASLTRGCAGGLQVAWHPSAATCSELAPWCNGTARSIQRHEIRGKRKAG